MNGQCVCGYHECKPDTTGTYKGYSANYSKHWQECIVKGCNNKLNEDIYTKIANVGCGYPNKVKEYTVTVIPVCGNRVLSGSTSKYKSGEKVSFTADTTIEFNFYEYEFTGWDVSGASSSSSGTTIEFIMPSNNVQVKQMYTVKK